MFIGYTPRTAPSHGLVNGMVIMAARVYHIPCQYSTKIKDMDIPYFQYISMKELVNYPFKKTRV
jgi:hypothetical protein